MRVTRKALRVSLVKRFDGRAEVPGLAAHFVQRHKAIVNIERGIFHAFGRDRARALLELLHKGPPKLFIHGMRIILLGKKNAPQKLKDGAFQRWIPAGAPQQSRGG